MITFVPSSSRAEVDSAKIERLLTAALLPGLEEIGARESAAIRQALSVDVGRNAKGQVTQRSKPGEPPRRETGELKTEIQYAVLPTSSGPVLEIGSARPSTPSVPMDLEYGTSKMAARPFMAPALLRMKRYALVVLASNAGEKLGGAAGFAPQKQPAA